MFKFCLFDCLLSEVLKFKVLGLLVKAGHEAFNTGCA